MLSMPGMPAPGFRPAFGDNVAALALAYGVMMALFVRERTGVGQEVDVALFHTGLYHIGFSVWPQRLVRNIALADWLRPGGRIGKRVAEIVVQDVGSERAGNPPAE